MSVLNVQVSCFRNYNDTKPINIGLMTFLNSKKYVPHVERIRLINDKNERDKLKAQLPAITPSGIFSKRGKEYLIKHSGLICIDIDYKDNQHIGNFSELKAELCKLPEIAYCGLSVSGRGFWLLIPIQYPSKHDYQFEALKADFEGLGIVIDTTPDVCRLRGYSYDENAYFNHYAKKYRRFIKPQPEKYQSRQQLPQTNESVKVEVILKQIEANRIDITGTYADWFAIGCAFANEFGESGRDYFHRVSQYYSKYSISATDKQFDYCKRGKGFTIATFYQISEHYGLYYKNHLRIT